MAAKFAKAMRRGDDRIPEVLVGKVFRAALNKDRLLSIEPAERALFLALGHVANEINILHKQILWSARFDLEPDAVAKAQVGLCYTFVRLLAGKLNEAGQLLKSAYLTAKLGETYDDLLDAKAADALAFLKRYFSTSNRIRVIRRDFAFHYSPTKLDACLPTVVDELELFVSTHYGNSMYYACEVVANRAMLDALGKGPHEQILPEVMQEVLNVAREFTAFASGFMTAFLHRHSDIWTGAAEHVELPKLKPLFDVYLPWFTDNSAVERGGGSRRAPKHRRAAARANHPRRRRP